MELTKTTKMVIRLPGRTCMETEVVTQGDFDDPTTVYNHEYNCLEALAKASGISKADWNYLELSPLDFDGSVWIDFDKLTGSHIAYLPEVFSGGYLDIETTDVSH